MVIWPELAERISDEEPVRFRAFRVAALWLGMAVLGVVLAFGAASALNFDMNSEIALVRRRISSSASGPKGGRTQ